MNDTTNFTLALLFFFAFGVEIMTTTKMKSIQILHIGKRFFKSPKSKRIVVYIIYMYICVKFWTIYRNYHGEKAKNHEIFMPETFRLMYVGIRKKKCFGSNFRTKSYVM